MGILYAGYLSSYIGADITYIINNLAIITIVCLVFKNIDMYAYSGLLLKNTKYNLLRIQYL